MVFDKADGAMSDEPLEELQEMLPGPPKRKTGRWTVLGLAAALLAVAGVGAFQAGLLSPRKRSALQRITAVHEQIHAIVKTAVEASAMGENRVGASLNLVVDDYENAGSPPADMTISSHVQLEDDEEKWPKIVLTLAAKVGKGADLKQQIEDIKAAYITVMGCSDEEKQTLDETMTITQEADTVTVVTEAPRDAQMEEEDHLLKAAFKTHKPEFHADLGFGRTFEGMHAVHDKSVALAPRGISVKLDASFASSIFALIAPMAGEQQAAALRALRMLKATNEMYYSSEEELLGVLPPFPPLKHAVNFMCSQVPGEIAKKLVGLEDNIAGVSRLVLEGLPYDFEVVTDFENFNPGHIIGKHCAIAS